MGERQDAAVDRWDVIAAIGAVLLFVGLWLWASLGCALTVLGGLAVLLGVIGARAAITPAGDAAHRSIGRST